MSDSLRPGALQEIVTDYREARRKMLLLRREVGQVTEEVLRSNMNHTLSKLWMSVSNMLDYIPGARAELERQMKEAPVPPEKP